MHCLSSGNPKMAEDNQLPGSTLLNLIMFLSFSCPCYVDGVAVRENVEVHQTKVMHQWNGYGSAQIFHFTIPRAAIVSRFELQAVKLANNEESAASCPNRTIHVAFQSGSFPVVNPRNASFPANTWLKRTNVFQVNVTSRSWLEMKNPAPGDWFAAGYLSHQPEKITQRDLTVSCTYMLGIIHTTVYLDEIPVLSDRGALYHKMPSSGSDIAGFRYFVPTNTLSIQVTVSDCHQSPVNSTVGCPVTLLLKPASLPLPGSEENSVNCSNLEEDCSIHSNTPPIQSTWYYLEVARLPGNLTISYNIQVKVTACEKPLDFLDEVGVSHQEQVNTSLPSHIHLLKKFPTNRGTVMADQGPGGAPLATMGQEVPIKKKHRFQRSLAESTHIEITSQNTLTNQCPVIHWLQRFKSPYPFQTTFVLDELDPGVPDSDRLSVFSFHILPVEDTGGTLNIGLDIWDPHPDLLVRVRLCFRVGAPPSQEDSKVSCEPGHELVTNGTDTWYFPFPEPGVWYLTLDKTCWNVSVSSNDSVEVDCSNLTSAVELRTEITPCINDCGQNGACHTYYSGVFFYAACSCEDDWAGWGCTDGTNSLSYDSRLTRVLLLTLSNLMFIPAICVAIYRKFYVAALVYTFNMFFSTFYHACDEQTVRYCLTKYSLLSFCDFFASVLSFVVTLVAMAKLPEPWRGLAHMAGALGVSAGVQYDAHGLWVFAVPVGVLALVVLISWILQCRKRKKMYPSVRRILFFLLPGAILAGTGLITYAFFETESNYAYLHSLWHVCISGCVPLVLPSRKKKTSPANNDHSEEMLDVSADYVPELRSYSASDSMLDNME
ncbi:post-GPI attachment to proteins factor 6-like [Branchiostoma lanceolatum]|uniref:post-GPI attachment to proteins factor 6-like n=1 Tax=Branchiostoma lanceolatum TaxID=7740 RepID=UPI0034556C91